MSTRMMTLVLTGYSVWRVTGMNSSNAILMTDSKGMGNSMARRVQQGKGKENTNVDHEET
jgi:hypothetical protein